MEADQAAVDAARSELSGQPDIRQGAEENVLSEAADGCPAASPQETPASPVGSGGGTREPPDVQDPSSGAREDAAAESDPSDGRGDDRAGAAPHDCGPSHSPAGDGSPEDDEPTRGSRLRRPKHLQVLGAQDWQLSRQKNQATLAHALELLLREPQDVMDTNLWRELMPDDLSGWQAPAVVVSSGRSQSGEIFPWRTLQLRGLHFAALTFYAMGGDDGKTNLTVADEGDGACGQATLQVRARTQSGQHVEHALTVWQDAAFMEIFASRPDDGPAGRELDVGPLQRLRWATQGV